MAQAREGNEDKEGPLSRLLSGIRNLVETGLPVEERRVGGRLECSMESSYVTETGASGVAQIVDISRRGLRMRTAASVSKGITLALSPPAEMSEHAALMARVVWSNKDGNGYVAGLSLPTRKDDQETWLEAYLFKQAHENAGPQRRKYVRADSELLGVLLRPNQPNLDVLVMNLGLGGALIRSDQAIEKLTPFRLLIGPHEGLAELELSGTILRHVQNEGERWIYHSTRFSPTDEKKANLLKRYVVKLLKVQRDGKKKRKKKVP